MLTAWLRCRRRRLFYFLCSLFCFLCGLSNIVWVNFCFDAIKVPLHRHAVFGNLDDFDAVILSLTKCFVASAWLQIGRGLVISLRLGITGVSSIMCAPRLLSSSLRAPCFLIACHRIGLPLFFLLRSAITLRRRLVSRLECCGG